MAKYYVINETLVFKSSLHEIAVNGFELISAQDYQKYVRLINNIVDPDFKLEIRCSDIHFKTITFSDIKKMLASATRIGHASYTALTTYAADCQRTIVADYISRMPRTTVMNNKCKKTNCPAFFSGKPVDLAVWNDQLKKGNNVFPVKYIRTVVNYIPGNKKPWVAYTEINGQKMYGTWAHAEPIGR